MSQYEARQAEPGQRFTVNDWQGVVELTADAKGIVQPKDALEESACIGLGLPVASKAAPAVQAASAVKEA